MKGEIIMEQKDLQKIRVLALTIILCLVAPTFGMSMPKKQSKPKPTKQEDVLQVIYEIDNQCEKLDADIKAIEAADSLNEFVWDHRDSLDSMSKDTLELFLSNLISLQLDSYPPENAPTVNTDTWKGIVSEEVVDCVNIYLAYKITIKKMYDDYWEKKQRIADTFYAEVEYSKDEVETPAEAVKKMLDSPEIRSLFGKQPIFCSILKAVRSTLKSMNTSNKNLMQVTDKELSEMFSNKHTGLGGISYKYTHHF